MELLFLLIGTKCCSFTLAAVSGYIMSVHTLGALVVWVPTTNLPRLSSTHDDDRGGFHNDERPHHCTKMCFDKISFNGTFHHDHFSFFPCFWNNIFKLCREYVCVRTFTFFYDLPPEEIVSKASLWSHYLLRKWW